MSWSSLRHWASRARSSSEACPSRPVTSTTTPWAAKTKSTRAMCRPFWRWIACVVGLGRPAVRISSRNRRSSGECPPESTSSSSSSRHPHRPEPRSVSRRLASTCGADNPTRTALSIEAAKRSLCTLAWARSTSVRVADVRENPSTVTRSISGIHRVVWTVNVRGERRVPRRTVNSTASWRDRSSPWSAAAAS